MSVHELYDVSVLFESGDAARRAFQEVFGTQDESVVVAREDLTCVATASASPMAGDDLDWRLAPPDMRLGGGYVGLNLGIVDAFSLRRMATNPHTGECAMPSAWRTSGRMRQATLLVLDLIAYGGHAVVLHKAGAAVKPAEMFQYEAGDLTDEMGERPYLAWLDVLASHDEDRPGAECRSYGMPHYFGEPNVRTVIDARDQFSLERAMQALKYACGRMAAGGETAQALREVRVPIWYTPGRESPRPVGRDEECFTWTGALGDGGLVLDLRSTELVERHPQRLWARGEVLGEDSYAKAVEDFVAARAAGWRMSMAAALRYGETADRPAVHIMVFDAHEITFHVTAGFGRLPSASGTNELTTAHAEFCLFAPTDDRRLHGLLLNLGEIPLSTPVEGGVKDYDSLPPEGGWGFVFAPLQDIPLGTPARPLGLRVLVALDVHEYAEMREAEDREAWYDERFPNPFVIAEQWGRFLDAL